MKYKTYAFALLFTYFFFTANAHADLILNISGVSGSNKVLYEATGSITITSSHNSSNSGLGLAPAGATAWASGFDNNLGDILSDTMDISFNDDLVLTNGGVSYRKNGVEFGVLDTLDLDGSPSAGGDDIELDTSVTIAYPSLVATDVVSWTGKGFFFLEDGETFDTLFVGLGSFSNPIDGGNYVVNIAQVSAVPEPGSLALCCSGVAGYVVYRRRKKKKEIVENDTPEEGDK